MVVISLNNLSLSLSLPNNTITVSNLESPLVTIILLHQRPLGHHKSKHFGEQPSKPPLVYIYIYIYTFPFLVSGISREPEEESRFWQWRSPISFQLDRPRAFVFFVVGSCWWARRAHPLIGQAGERSNRWYEPPPPGPLRSLPASSLALEQSSSLWAPSWLQHRWGRRWGRWRRHHHHP